MRVELFMFEGIKYRPPPKTVFSRGRPVIDAGKFSRPPAAPSFLRKRQPTPQICIVRKHFRQVSFRSERGICFLACWFYGRFRAPCKICKPDCFAP